MSSLSSSITNSTVNTASYNPKNLWQDFIPTITSYWDNNVSIELQSQLIWFGVAIAACLVTYCLYLLLSRHTALHKPRHLLRVTLAATTSSKLNFELLNLLSRLHTLSKSSVATFELHKSNQVGGGFVGFIFSSTDLSVLQVIRQNLVTTDGVSAEIVTEEQDLLAEPLATQFQAYQDKLSPRPYQLQLLSSSQFGNFRLDQNQLVQDLAASLLALDQEEYGSVVVSFRPVIKEHAIKSKIASLNFKSTKEAGQYGVNQNMLAEVKELQLKNQYPLFQVRIVVVGSSRQIVNNLASSFNLLSQDNRLNQRLCNFSLQALRYVPRQNLFTVFNRPAFGSLLNTRELSSLVQLASFDDGGELRNKEGVKVVRGKVLPIVKPAKLTTKDLDKKQKVQPKSSTSHESQPTTISDSGKVVTTSNDKAKVENEDKTTTKSKDKNRKLSKFWSYLFSFVLSDHYQLITSTITTLPNPYDPNPCQLLRKRQIYRTRLLF